MSIVNSLEISKLKALDNMNKFPLEILKSNPTIFNKTIESPPIVFSSSLMSKTDDKTANDNPNFACKPSFKNDDISKDERSVSANLLSIKEIEKYLTNNYSAKSKVKKSDANNSDASANAPINLSSPLDKIIENPLLENAENAITDNTHKTDKDSNAAKNIIDFSSSSAIIDANYIPENKTSDACDKTNEKSSENAMKSFNKTALKKENYYAYNPNKNSSSSIDKASCEKNTSKSSSKSSKENHLHSLLEGFANLKNASNSKNKYSKHNKSIEKLLNFNNNLALAYAKINNENMKILNKQQKINNKINNNFNMSDFDMNKMLFNYNVPSIIPSIVPVTVPVLIPVPVEKAAKTNEKSDKNSMKNDRKSDENSQENPQKIENSNENSLKKDENLDNSCDSDNAVPEILQQKISKSSKNSSKNSLNLDKNDSNNEEKSENDEENQAQNNEIEHLEKLLSAGFGKHSTNLSLKNNILSKNYPSSFDPSTFTTNEKSKNNNSDSDNEDYNSDNDSPSNILQSWQSKFKEKLLSIEKLNNRLMYNAQILNNNYSNYPVFNQTTRQIPNIIKGFQPKKRDKSKFLEKFANNTNNPENSENPKSSQNSSQNKANNNGSNNNSENSAQSNPANSQSSPVMSENKTHKNLNKNATPYIPIGFIPVSYQSMYTPVSSLNSALAIKSVNSMNKIDFSKMNFLQTKNRLQFDTVSTKEYSYKYVCNYKVQIENDDKFMVTKRIIGKNGCFLKKIIYHSCIVFGDQTTKIRLRGKGSGYLEGKEQKESDEPLMLCVSSLNYPTYLNCCKLVEKLLSTVYDDYLKFLLDSNVIPSDLKINLKKKDIIKTDFVVDRLGNLKYMNDLNDESVGVVN